MKLKLFVNESDDVLVVTVDDVPIMLQECVSSTDCVAEFTGALYEEAREEVLANFLDENKDSDEYAEIHAVKLAKKEYVLDSIKGMMLDYLQIAGESELHEYFEAMKATTVEGNYTCMAEFDVTVEECDENLSVLHKKFGETPSWNL